MMSNYDGRIIPMNVFTNAPLDVSSPLIDDAIQGPYQALHGIHTAFRRISRRDHETLLAPRFDKFIAAFNKCSVGFIKEVKQCNLSTSASVGCAARNFEFMQGPKNGVGLIFNFGTGGGKATACTSNSNGVIEVLFDIKPRDEAPSPNSVPLSSYAPAKPKDPQADATHFAAFIQQVCAELGKHSADVCWVEAFVTGPSREYYYNNLELQATMYEALREYMRPITNVWPKAKIHFLPQMFEAEYENCACASMYDTMSEKKLIVPSKVVPDTSCGIGRGSCQALFRVAEPIGMTALEQKTTCVNWLFDSIMRVMVEGSLSLDAFVNDVNSIIASGKQPIIPFKSGFALAFDNAKIASVLTMRFCETKNMLDRRERDVHMMFSPTNLLVASADYLQTLAKILHDTSVRLKENAMDDSVQIHM